MKFCFLNHIHHHTSSSSLLPSSLFYLVFFSYKYIYYIILQFDIRRRKWNFVLFCFGILQKKSFLNLSEEQKINYIYSFWITMALAAPPPLQIPAAPNWPDLSK